jgi:Flp pilus assembly pilin Flp
VKLVLNFAKDEPGAMAIEYGLIAAGIQWPSFATVSALGGKLNTRRLNAADLRRRFIPALD